MTSGLGYATLHAMARNALLANHRLYRACAGLSEAEYRAPRRAFFGSIHETLKHVLEVDLHYLALIEHGESSGSLDPADPRYANRDGLAAAQEAVDRRLLAMVAQRDEAALSKPVRYTRPSGVACVNPLSSILLHVFLHDVHHRGQVHDMLSQTGVAPPQLDEFLLSEDASLRDGEERALGLG